MPRRTTAEARTSPANSTPVAKTEIELASTPTAMFSTASRPLTQRPARATRLPVLASGSSCRRMAHYLWTAPVPRPEGFSLPSLGISPAAAPGWPSTASGHGEASLRWIRLSLDRPDFRWPARGRRCAAAAEGLADRAFRVAGQPRGRTGVRGAKSPWRRARAALGGTRYGRLRGDAAAPGRPAGGED